MSNQPRGEREHRIESDAPSPGARLDLAQLPTYVGYQVRQAQLAVFKDISRALNPSGVTPGEFSLMTLIGANPGVSQTALAAAYALDKSTLSHAVNRLVGRALIVRRQSTPDRRVNALYLTRSGTRELRRATREIERQEAVMEGALDDGERAALIDMLGRIAHALNMGRE